MKKSAIEMINLIVTTARERRHKLHDNETAMYSLALQSDGKLQDKDLADFVATLPADHDPAAGAALAEAVESDVQSVRDLDDTPADITPADVSSVATREKPSGPTTVRINTEEFVQTIQQNLARSGRVLADITPDSVLVAAEVAIGSFSPDVDLQALGRVARIAEDVYGKFQRLQKASDATEDALRDGIRRELVSALRARGPYSGFGGNKVSMM